MAGMVRVSEATVRRIRRAHGLKPYASGSEPLAVSRPGSKLPVALGSHGLRVHFTELSAPKQ